MTGHRVLLVDNSYYPSNPFFARPLQDAGIDHFFVDEARHIRLPRWRLPHAVVYRALGHRPPGYWRFNRALVRAAREFQPSVVLVVKGAYVATDALASVKRDTGAVLVNFATDDPTNPAASSPSIRASIPLFDLYACTKRAIIPDVLAAGCPRAVFVPFGFNRTVHYPEEPKDEQERERYRCEVSFVGTMAEGRDEYFVELLLRRPGVDLHLYGTNWDRHPVLGPHFRGVADARTFRLVSACSRISVNLVRKANRDGHVMRSFEVPACRGFMLAEPTDEHLELLGPGRAGYFADKAELVERVDHFLSHETERQGIIDAGSRHVIDGGNSYHERLTQILEHVAEVASP
jgi:hypothetical protein